MLATNERASQAEVPFAWVAAGSIHGSSEIELPLRRTCKGHVLRGTGPEVAGERSRTPRMAEGGLKCSSPILIELKTDRHKSSILWWFFRCSGWDTLKATFARKILRTRPGAASAQAGHLQKPRGLRGFVV
jgi:hypothetical protein